MVGQVLKKIKNIPILFLDMWHQVKLNICI